MSAPFKIKLAAIAKDEGFYLPLWVYHHLRFGFDVLDIRVNDTTDNSLQILEKLKAIYGERLRFSLADQEMEICRAQDFNFQVYIYTQIHQETLTEDFTHLMFLDIDEYWCAANFEETIEDFLATHADFGICMFQWLMETPNALKQIGDVAFDSSLVVQKSDHVKSLLDLKSTVIAIRIHNYVLKAGNYVLSNEAAIQFNKEDRSRGILPKDFFEANRAKLSEYFVYHQVFRSQDEYLAGLLRGNKQSGDDSLLKTNRFGFVATSPKEFNLVWTIPDSALNTYQLGYKQLISGLNDELNTARHFVLGRKDAVLTYLQDDVFLQKLHGNKLRGLSPAIYTPKKISHFIKAKVENINFDEQAELCSFTCEIISGKFEYQLLMTQGFSKDPVAARIKLVKTEQLTQRMIQQFSIEIAMADLSYVVYLKWPPFCLAAKVDDELFLLARGEFHDLGKLIAPKAARLRKLAIQKKQSFLKKLMSKF